MDLLNKYKVHVGVSIDGTKEHNDKYRVDNYGNGSYDAVVKGIKLLQENLFSKPGCLTVVNPEFDSRLIYRHLIDLGFRSLDFLLPDNSYVKPPPYPIEQYTEYFINLFNEWAKVDNIECRIRKFNSMRGSL